MTNAMNELVDSRKIFFTASASLMHRLGEELIRDAHTAFFELIKNSYDADATKVDVHFPEGRGSDGKLIIRDNGSGMTLEDIIEKWARSGGENKVREPLSPVFNRRRQGSKGIGRFSLAKLGTSVKVATRAKGAFSQLVFRLDFSDFTDSRDLGDMSIECKAGPPRKGFGQGTILELSGLRDRWGRTEIRKLKNQLAHLVDAEKDHQKFRIELHCPAHPDLSGVLENPLVGKHSHCLEFDIAANGEFLQKLSVGSNEPIVVRGGRPPLSCGPVKGVIRYFKDGVHTRDRRLSDGSEDSHMGIKVYRDSCRVRPYGEESDDWLGIKGRRARGGGKYYVQPTCIAGSVYVSAEENPGLKDATNREAGMIENDEFEEFRAFVEEQVSTLNNALEQETRSESQRQKRKTVKKILDTVVRCLNREESDVYRNHVAKIDRSKRGKSGATTHSLEGPISDAKPSSKEEWHCLACDARWRTLKGAAPERCLDLAVNRSGEPRHEAGCGSDQIERSTHEPAAGPGHQLGLISGEYALVDGRQLYVRVDPEMGANEDEFVVSEREIVINGNHPAYKVAEALDHSTGKKFEFGDDFYTPALTIHICKDVCRAWAELHFKETKNWEDFTSRFDGLQDRICTSIRKELQGAA